MDIYGFNKEARLRAERAAQVQEVPPLEPDFPYTVEMFPFGFFSAEPSIGDE